MNSKQLNQLKIFFKAYSDIKLVYFFGSRARKEAGPQSDYDFAFYLDSTDKHGINRLKLELQAKISYILKTDKVDVVALNLAAGPELKYSIISEGRLIYEAGPFRLLVEPRILNEYFDYKLMLEKNFSGHF
jgi:predicted nucleotidyltransferase